MSDEPKSTLFVRSTSTEETDPIFSKKLPQQSMFYESVQKKPDSSSSTNLLTADDDPDSWLQKEPKQSLIPSESVTLTWNNINVFTKQKRAGLTEKYRVIEPKQILYDVSCIVQPGQIVALMGASGAGKTTLLNSLMQRNVRDLDVSGRVYINGEEIGRQITYISAYVQQDDIFIGTLTTREHLMFQARLRLPSNTSQTQRINRVDDLLHDLGLKKCQNTRIGGPGMTKGISGGEAKRLAFASELITNPGLLFCDEPTTGLDSYMAESVVTVLERLAKSGKTIICTIHQPASEIYAMFHRVMFLAEGRTVFFGSTENAIDFFHSQNLICPSDFNPADFFVHTLAIVPGKEEESRQRIEQLCAYFEQSEDGEELSQLVLRNSTPAYRTENNVSKTSMYKANCLIQFWALLCRSILNNYRTKSVVMAKLLQKCVLGLFVGLVYLQTELNQMGIMNINGALYFLVNNLIYPTLFGVLNHLPSEYPLLVREHHNGMYTVAVYYISKAVSFVPSFSIDGIVLILISYFMVGLRPTAGALFFTVFLTIFLEQISVSVGTMFSAVSPSLPVAISISGPVLALVSLTSGMYANLGLLPTYLSWIQYVSWFRYGFETFSINQWHSITNISCVDAEQICTKTGDIVLQNYSFSSDNLGFDLILMLLLLLAFHLIGYIGLMIRVYKAR